MNKAIFKVVDEKGKVLLPQAHRASLGIEKGNIVSLTAEKGKISVKKAVVIADENVPIEAKECYVQSVVREFEGPALVELLELIAGLIQEIAGTPKSD